MKVVLIGATGLVGSHLLELLLNDSLVTEVTTITRAKIMKESSKLNQFIYPNLEEETLNNLNLDGDSFICCLGTTIKAAKSKEAFRKIDLDLVCSFAHLAQKSKTKSLHIISSKGSNSLSSFFYNKTKGEMENVIKKLSIPSIYFYRPSLLIGNRKENRSLEKIGIETFKLIKDLIPKKLKKNIGTNVDCLAKKMAMDIHGQKSGVHFIEAINI